MSYRWSFHNGKWTKLFILVLLFRNVLNYFIMENQKLKEGPSAEMIGKEASKRLHQETNDDESLTDSYLPNSPVSSASILNNADNTSSSSSTSGQDEPEAWNIPINSKTKELCFMPVDPGGGSHVQKLDDYSRQEKLDKLKSIDIDFTQTIEYSNDEQDGKISEILNRIFSATVDSLEEIILRNPIGYLPNLVFPVMKNVVKLQLLFYWWGSDATSVTGYLRGGKIFPKGFKFSVLPKLEEIIIELETEGKGPQYYSRFDCWKNNLKSCGIAKNVKKIQYSDDCGFSTNRLKTTFPKAIWSGSYSKRNQPKDICTDSSSEDDYPEAIWTDSSSEDD